METFMFGDLYGIATGGTNHIYESGATHISNFVQRNTIYGFKFAYSKEESLEVS